MAAAFSAAACATSPSTKKSGSPVDALSPVSSRLALCRGLAVANAPPVHSNGDIADFTPYTSVRGVALALAPVDGCLSSGFGPRRGGAGRNHNGIDLFTRTPQTIRAAGDGRISFLGAQSGFGYTVVIDHGSGVETVYAHLSRFEQGVGRGARVRQGEAIGLSGATGNATAVHLHYEIRIDGRARDPFRVGR